MMICASLHIASSTLCLRTIGSHAVSEQLNELGEDGWRLVGSIIEEGYTTKLILIRERAV